MVLIAGGRKATEDRIKSDSEVTALKVARFIARCASSGGLGT
jgi:hypothetical protein